MNNVFMHVQLVFSLMRYSRQPLLGFCPELIGFPDVVPVPEVYGYRELTDAQVVTGLEAIAPPAARKNSITFWPVTFKHKRHACN